MTTLIFILKIDIFLIMMTLPLISSQVCLCMTLITALFPLLGTLTSYHHMNVSKWRLKNPIIITMGRKIVLPKQEFPGTICTADTIGTVEQQQTLAHAARFRFNGLYDKEIHSTTQSLRKNNQ